jgi:hypothetical protein
MKKFLAPSSVALIGTPRRHVFHNGPTHNEPLLPTP